MRLEIKRERLRIIPESPQDEIYLEEILGIQFPGDHCRLICRKHEGGPEDGHWIDAESETMYDKQRREDEE